jgi:hypothetical protein
VLALRVIEGYHTGENLAPIVLDILQDYSITHKLGYIQIDNATNNDTLMAALSSGIYVPIVFILIIILIHKEPFPMIMMPLNIECAALATSLTLRFRLSCAFKTLNKQKGPLLTI